LNFSKIIIIEKSFKVTKVFQKLKTIFSSHAYIEKKITTTAWSFNEIIRVEKN